VCGTQRREEKHTERILVRKRERKRPLEICRHGWQNKGSQRNWAEEHELVSPASGWWQVAGNYGHGYVPLGSIKWEEFHDWLTSEEEDFLVAIMHPLHYISMNCSFTVTTSKQLFTFLLNLSCNK